MKICITGILLFLMSCGSDSSLFKEGSAQTSSDEGTTGTLNPITPQELESTEHYFVDGLLYNELSGYSQLIDLTSYVQDSVQIDFSPTTLHGTLEQTQTNQFVHSLSDEFLDSISSQSDTYQFTDELVFTSTDSLGAKKKHLVYIDGTIDLSNLNSNGGSSQVPQDTDGDGLLDEQDACPLVYGNILNQGCPIEGGSGTDDPGLPVNKCGEGVNQGDIVVRGRYQLAVAQDCSTVRKDFTLICTLSSITSGGLRLELQPLQNDSDFIQYPHSTCSSVGSTGDPATGNAQAKADCNALGASQGSSAEFIGTKDSKNICSLSSCYGRGSSSGNTKTYLGENYSLSTQSYNGQDFYKACLISEEATNSQSVFSTHFGLISNSMNYSVHLPIDSFVSKLNLPSSTQFRVEQSDRSLLKGISNASIGVDSSGKSLIYSVDNSQLTEGIFYHDKLEIEALLGGVIIHRATINLIFAIKNDSITIIPEMYQNDVELDVFNWKIWPAKQHLASEVLNRSFEITRFSDLLQNYYEIETFGCKAIFKGEEIDIEFELNSSKTSFSFTSIDKSKIGYGDPEITVLCDGTFLNQVDGSVLRTGFNSPFNIKFD